MDFRHDRRGQSVVVGTVILFGFLILAMAAYQAQFVPAENDEVEFEHSQQVEGEFLDLRNAILRAGSTGAAQSQSVQLGVRYPQRTLFLNPPPATGTLETTGTDPVEVNGTIASGAHENVDAFWATNPQFNTTSLRYTPSYNEYDGGPRLLYEHSVVAAEFDDALLLRSDQTVVRDDRIAVTTLRGAVSENGVEAQSVDPETISRRRGTVPITGSGGDPVEIVLPTAAGNTTALRDRWQAELPGATVTEDGDAIRIALDGTETYRLGLSAVAVDGGGTTDPAYVVPVGGENAVVGDSIGVEVRDKYNNPVADAQVSIDGTTHRTGSDGRVFTEAGAAGTIDATINGGGESYELVTFDVSAAGGGGGANRTFRVDWQDADPKQLTEGTDDTLTVEVTDRDTSEPINDASIDYSFSAIGNPMRSIDISLATGNHDGTATIDLSSNDAQAGDEFDVYAAAGDDVDVIRVEITATPTMASDAEITGSQAGAGGGSEVEFDVSNNGNNPVEIRAISLDSTDSSATVVSRSGNPGSGNPELEFDGAGSLDQDIQISGTEFALDTNESISAGATSTGTLDRFKDGGGSQIDMSGQQVTLTLYFTDGSERTYTLSIPN